MHKRTTGTVLPAMAVAAALVLTGCNGDEESPAESAPSEGAEQGGNAEDGDSQGPKPSDLSDIDASGLPEGVSPEDLVDLVPEDLEDLIPWEELEDLGIPGINDEEEAPPNAATVDELQGIWWTGPDSEDAALDFTDNDVVFIEDFLAEGDICYGDTTDGALELNECSVYGSTEWSAKSATLAIDGPALVVTWEDGTVQEYFTDPRGR